MSEIGPLPPLLEDTESARARRKKPLVRSTAWSTVRLTNSDARPRVVRSVAPILGLVTSKGLLQQHARLTEGGGQEGWVDGNR